MIKKFIHIVCFVIPLVIQGQSPDSVAIINLNDLEQIVENEELESDLDIDNFYDELSSIVKNPYNINTVTPEELDNLNLLLDIQIQEFIRYRNQYGPFVSIYELQAIPNWNVLTIQRVLPFVSVKERVFTSQNMMNMATGGDHLLAFKWKSVFQERAGFDPERSPEYLGDPNHYYVRYRYNFNNKLRWGLTSEKDAGEPFFGDENPYGMDYYSLFLHYYDVRAKLQSFTIGDYTLSMGQGLIAHNAFGSGKSTRVLNVKKSGRVARPYSSVNEVNFFRGITAQYQLNDKVTIVPFVSLNRVDGTVNIDTTVEDGFDNFSSLIDDGYHRTRSELDKKNAIKQTAFGGIVKVDLDPLEIGVNVVQNKFDRPFDPGTRLYRKFVEFGDQLRNVSVDFSYRSRNASFFGEYATSNNGGKAFMIGNQTSLNRILDVALVYRDYGRDYIALRPNSFGESRNANNERGLYMGISADISRAFSVSLYHDTWKHPWLRFRTDAPSYGRETLIRADYIKKRKFLLYVQYKNEVKAINLQQSEQIRGIQDTRIQRLRLHFNHQVRPGLELRNRVEFSHFNSEEKESTGWMLYQDIIVRPVGSRFSLTGRIALFDTDDFDSRIYAFENDIQYEFRIPFYQMKGTRMYFFARYKVTRRMTLEARIDRTFLTDAEEIGSGGEEILGNERNEIKAQMIYRW